MWDLLICPTCKDLFEKPKILPCVHTICEKCLEVLLKQKSDVLECPVCRVVIKVPASGFSDIPSNFFLSSVLDILKRETSACNEDIACDSCSVIGMKNLRCEDCDLLLCTKCLHAHHDSVITYALDPNEHAQTVIGNERITSVDESELQCVPAVKTVETISTPNETHGYKASTRNEIGKHETEFTQNDTRDHQVHMPLKCKRHHREDLHFFCISCAQLVCQDCVIAKHITHIFVSAKDVAPSSKAQLSTLLNQTTIRVLYLSEALRDTKDAEDKLRSCVADIMNTIRAPYQQTTFAGEITNLEQDAILKRNTREKKPVPEDHSTTLIPHSDSRESCPILDDNLSSPLPQSNNPSLLPHSDSCPSSLPQNYPGPLPQSNNPSPLPQSDSCPSSLPQSYPGSLHRSNPCPLDEKHQSPEEDLSNELKTVARRKLEILAKHRKKLGTRLALIENCQRFTMNLILSGSDEEVLMLENCIMESLGQLCQNTPEVPIECPDDSFIALTWPANLRPGSEKCGDSKDEETKIVKGEGCSSCCFATGEGLTNVVVGQDCTFTVTVKNEQNKPCIEGRNSLVARIKTPNGGYFKAELIEHKLGKHKFRFRTYSAGPHILRITLRGDEILGSPFETLSSGSTDYSRRGRLVTKFGRLGSDEGELCQPQGLAVDRLSRIFVADTGNHRVQVFDESGRFLFAFGRKGTGPGEFNEPCDVTIASTGHVIVADKLNDRLQFFTPDGKFMQQMHCGIRQPVAITTDQNNNILIVDSDSSQVLVLTMSGERLRSITRGSSSSVRLENVQNVACNQTGETFVISRIPALNSGVITTTKQTHASLVQVFDNTGAYIREFATPSYTRAIPYCCRLVTDYDDRVLATGSGNKVQVFTRVGGHLTNITFTEKDCSQIDISAIALSPSEAIVVADTVNGRVLVF